MARLVTARAMGMTPCPTCQLLTRLPEDPALLARCPRCGTRLHARIPNSIGRTWAYLIAAVALYFPANLLPIMTTHTLFGDQTNTIMSGITYLWIDGSWPLAIIVFIASIAVPLLKLIVMAILLVTVQRRSKLRPLQRTKVYRFVEFIGRWSMLDIYVVALLASLVQVQSVADVDVGPAAFAFGAVVVLTLRAAQLFDPRLIWDPVDDGEHEEAY